MATLAVELRYVCPRCGIWVCRYSVGHCRCGQCRPYYSLSFICNCDYPFTFEYDYELDLFDFNYSLDVWMEDNDKRTNH